MVFASLLWAFEIVPVEEVDTMAMDVAGFMTAPSGFRFGIRPRGPWVEETLIPGSFGERFAVPVDFYL
ncbi:hypothetical protein CH063_08229 [Colletotrichum higginsianum]|uniref:Uncharacterized protein n=1 Tax=Colletotrichum higginsianum (strain IMI 349063) TaxID=759273 RepID=H1V924_COLHI|nr:hypothetical protein CH063_08229 [Colletotrichum higginsianum]